MRLLRLTLVVVFALGCGDYVCTLQPLPAIRLFVRDSVTQANLLGGATIVLRGGAYVDSVTVPSGTPETAVQVGMNHWGKYQLTVRRTGYRDWLQPSVSVENDRCGPLLLEMVALLQAG